MTITRFSTQLGEEPRYFVSMEKLERSLEIKDLDRRLI